jgi:hypothetical protein
MSEIPYGEAIHSGEKSAFRPRGRNLVEIFNIRGSGVSRQIEVNSFVNTCDFTGAIRKRCTYQQVLGAMRLALTGRLGTGFPASTWLERLG